MNRTRFSLWCCYPACFWGEVEANYVDIFLLYFTPITCTQVTNLQLVLFFCFELPARSECTFCLCTSVDPTCSCLQVKCDQYWPARGTETYGMIQVTMLDTVELATYSVRTFALYKVPPRRSRAEPRRGRMYSVCGHICTFLTQATHFQIPFFFF